MLFECLKCQSVNNYNYNNSNAVITKREALKKLSTADFKTDWNNRLLRERFFVVIIVTYCEQRTNYVRKKPHVQNVCLPLVYKNNYPANQQHNYYCSTVKR